MRMIAWLTLVLSCIACSRTNGPRAANARDVRRATRIAARDLRCPARDIVITALDPRVVQATGCGTMREYALGVGRSREWSPMIPAHARAMVEMSCPSEQLRVTAPSRTRRMVEGCGRLSVYDLACTPAECAWWMTGHTGAWAGAAQSQAGAGDLSIPPGYSSDPVSSTPSVSTATIPEPPDPGSPEASVRAAVDGRRDALLRCSNAPITLRASWDTGGILTFAVEGGPEEGALVECVRAAMVGTRIEVPVSAPGTLSHPLF